MHALAQSSGPGSAVHACRRARAGVAHVGYMGCFNAAFVAAHQGAVGSGERQPIRSLSAKNYNFITKELIDAHPALREAAEELTRNRRNAPIYIKHKEDPSKQSTVLRREFLAASTSLPAAEDFLKQQLGIKAEQKVKITYSLALSPDEACLAEEFELNEQTLEERPMPYLVAYANGWLVSEL